MSTQDMFTELPTVSSATMQDIICAVQGYSLPSSLGLSVQENLGQVFQLFQNNIILYNAGNPNGAVAGSTFVFCWDTVDNILWICTTTGTASTAVWTKVIQLTEGPGISISQAGNIIEISTVPMVNEFIVVTGASASMAVNTTYQSDSATLVTLTLPTVSNLGDEIAVTGYGAGGWTIAQNASQNIQIGNKSTTVGTGGSVSSTNLKDGIELVCTVANTTWQTINGPQGNLTIV